MRLGLIPIAAICRTALLAAWNAPVVTMLRRERKILRVGCTAIRRRSSSIGVLHVWRTRSVDDYSLTACAGAHNRSIVFIPDA